MVSEVQQGFVKRVILLSWFTIGYNFLEGLFSIAFGIENESIALAGFGVDSFIEVGSAMLVLWRFRSESFKSADQSYSLQKERSATLGIGVLFLALSAGTTLASVLQISNGSHPETTWPGLLIAAISLSFMFFLWSSKRKLAIALDSSTVMKDANCSLACIKLSIVLFAGSILFLIFPQLWWVDSAAALVLALFIGKEGWETVSTARSESFSGGCGCSHQCD